MKRLDPKAIWLFYVDSLIAVVSVVIGFVLLFEIALKGVFEDIPLEKIAKEFQIPGLIIFLVENWWIIPIFIAIIGYLWSYLRYRFYKYELRDDGFRKEYGVIYKKYVTIPYERIQNVDINRDLLPRILGLSDLNIQTAGMSASIGVGRYSGVSEGRLPCVSSKVAEQLRDELVKRALGKHQGL